MTIGYTAWLTWMMVIRWKSEEEQWFSDQRQNHVPKLKSYSRVIFGLIPILNQYQQFQ
jgi:hypothetical protein